MRRFTFSLDTLLNYRVRLEGLAENEYRRAQAELNRARERLAELDERRRAVLRRHGGRPGERLEPGWLELLGRSAEQLLALSEAQQQVIAACEQEARRRLREWHERRRDAEVMRRLKQKKRAAWLREAEREEQKMQDDLFIAKKVREGLT